jgi:hypothetical protein
MSFAQVFLGGSIASALYLALNVYAGLDIEGLLAYATVCTLLFCLFKVSAHA